MLVFYYWDLKNLEKLYKLKPIALLNHNDAIGFNFYIFSKFFNVLLLLPVVEEFPCGAQLVAHYAQELLAFL